MSETIKFIHNIVKEYPDMYKVCIYKEPLVIQIPECRSKRSHYIVDNENYTPEVSSLHRTKTLLKDLVLCNDFDVFATFTFDPNKIDSFNFMQCLFCITKWLSHQKEKSPDLKYLIVPEPHKSGRWHFHALLKNFKGSVRPSHHYSPTGLMIYNITSFRSGYSTLVYIENKVAVSEYVSKYITKDFIKMFNQRRFYCSQGLTRPIKSVNAPIAEFSFPLFKHKVCESDMSEYFIYDKI